MENITKGCIFNIQRFSIHDGPGIRTTIFFKGCPLLCTWCSNPESQNFSPEKIWDNQTKKYIITGTHLTVEEVMIPILKDLDYYKESHGGITLSGGEVLSQSKFAIELLKKCKKLNIHTACETSGFSSQEIFSEFISYLDLVILDIKHYNNIKHKEGTNVDIDLILENLKYLISSKKEITIRIPIIPNFNDSLEDARNFVILFKNYNVNKIELLPFHQFGKSKYSYLDREYKFNGIKQLHENDLKDYKEIFIQNGIECSIS